MRHTRMRSPWLREASLEERMESRKRHRRDSHSSERENKHRKKHHQHHNNSDGHYLETRSSNERLETKDRRAVFRDHEEDSRGACKDKERDRDRDGSRCRERDRGRDRDRDWHHYSKSSGNSRRSSRHRHRHRRSHHHSDSRSHRRKRSRSIEDDEEGHLIYHSGDILRARYEIVCTLGEGAFGKVVECIDHEKGGARVALKIIKNIERYRDAAVSEVEVLEQINSLDCDRRYACVRMYDWFDHHGHICIAFELLGLSTYDFLKENSFQPFSINHIRHMAYQIIRAVRYIFNSLTKTALIQTCSCCFQLYIDRTLAVIVCIVSYNRDNCLFLTDLGWSHSCDVWSVGCILIEYYLGSTLFQTHDSKEHLAMMERVLGPLPTHMLQKTRKKRYVRHDKLDWDVHSSSGRYVRKQCKPLRQYIGSSSSDHAQLFDLIERMLEYDVTKRITLDEAIKHPFFDSIRKSKK
uniref:dual-specificity kinase n=1 Tax=Cyprinus carpio TaxID=7962 RepID=A0A8C1TTU4_CYPCA